MNDKKLEFITQIICSYISKNPLSQEQVLKFTTKLHDLFSEFSQTPEQTPAINIKKSITDDHIFCLEDGKPMKVLTGHLKKYYNMTPAQYRTKWNLPADYPMVAKNHKEHLSKTAKLNKIGNNLKKI